MDHETITNTILTALALVQTLQLFIITDIRQRLFRLENRYIECNGAKEK